MLNAKECKKQGSNVSDSNSLDTNRSILQFKIVYWGPGESGKTTNFIRLREKFSYIKLNKGYSIETTDGRTLWQDSFFLSFNFTTKEKLFSVIVQIVTCTGQERFLSTREYILDGADGIIFVGDSNPDKNEENKRSFRELISFAKSNRIPYIVQLNKRDVENAISIDIFKKQLNLPAEEKYDDGTLIVYPSVAVKGEGVMKCFEDLLIQVIKNYFNQ